MNENLKLKSISELLDESFFIPSYQRGYRWNKQQVKDLLDDILEFSSNKTNNGFYCLQPIVIKENKENNHWEVLDGQQRLTTIYILLHYFKNLLEEEYMVNNIYSLLYETRKNSESFLKNIDEKQKDGNIDYSHIYQAYEVIKEWFEIAIKEKYITKRKFLEVLMGGDQKDVKVIWYEISDSSAKDTDIFTRINMGKIPLTNAELIKALLLQGFKDKNKQFEVASQWDDIEYSLQKDDFWLFINKDINTQATRIEFIFDLIAEKYIKENEVFKKSLNKSIDTFYTFHIINHKLKNDENYQALWDEVKRYYRILFEWYDNREFFHKIGFLIIYTETKLLDFIAEYTKVNSTKQEFRNYLNGKIKEQLKDIDISELRYGSDNKKIRKILLLFNIKTLIQNENSSMKFQFDLFKKEKWDIEHIRSQTDNDTNRNIYPEKDKRKTWWESIKILPKTDEEIDIENLESKEFEEFYDKKQREIEGDEDFDKHNIGNLTLLNADINRGYGNAFFHVKRNAIIEKDKQGFFIPLCTKNAFMKFYNKQANNLTQWNKDDASSYTEIIRETLINYLENEDTKGGTNE